MHFVSQREDRSHQAFIIQSLAMQALPSIQTQLERLDGRGPACTVPIDPDYVYVNSRTVLRYLHLICRGRFRGFRFLSGRIGPVRSQALANRGPAHGANIVPRRRVTSVGSCLELALSVSCTSGRIPGEYRYDRRPAKVYST